MRSLLMERESEKWPFCPYPKPLAEGREIVRTRFSPSARGDEGEEKSQ